ncbi:MAG: alanine racemase [Verrucomicrobiae bacterium]|nr:alanine racemase [Verrucomicrobiae bacterium]
MRPRCWAEIDLEAIRHNAAVCRTAAPPHNRLMAIVKADAYGHGVEAVARALADCVEGFGVANVTEAEGLAKTLGTVHAGRVLILGPVLPEERIPAIDGNFAVPVSNHEEVDAFLLAAKAVGKSARVHAVVNTGMGRMGAQPEALPDLIEHIRNLKEQTRGAIVLDGVASHFPSADEESEFTRSQIARFQALIASLKLGPEVRIHLANSAGLLEFGPQLGFTTESRPGLAIYGVAPVARHQSRLHPAMMWKTRVTLVREIQPGDTISYGRTFVAKAPMRAATLAVGYADGYPRSLSGNGADVLIGGRRCPLLGRVTMDQVIVDVTDLPTPPLPGDEVVLMGQQENEIIHAAELAEKAGTIPWEILTGITGRVARRYR